MVNSVSYCFDDYEKLKLLGTTAIANNYDVNLMYLKWKLKDDVTSE